MGPPWATASFRAYPFTPVWCFSVGICSIMVLSIGCREIHASPWSLHALRVNLCSGAWSLLHLLLWPWCLWDCFSHFFLSTLLCYTLLLCIFTLSLLCFSQRHHQLCWLSWLWLVVGLLPSWLEPSVSHSRQLLASSNIGHPCNIHPRCPKPCRVHPVLSGTLLHLLQSVDPHFMSLPICSGLQTSSI